MDRLPKDLHITIALELSPPDLLDLCRTKKRYARNICDNEDFWWRKIARDYPDVDVKAYDRTVWSNKAIYQTLSTPQVVDITILLIDVQEDEEAEDFTHYEIATLINIPQRLPIEAVREVLLQGIKDFFEAKNLRPRQYSTFNIGIDGRVTEDLHELTLESFQEFDRDSTDILIEYNLSQYFTPNFEDDNQLLEDSIYDAMDERLELL
jgi:hypothetical protein